MKIQHFEIENFRSLKHLKIEEFDKTTIFYGLNNAGKSNILNALHFIFKRKPKLSQATLSELENFHSGVLPNFNSNYYNHSRSEIKFNLTLEIDSKALDIDPTISSLFTKTGNCNFKFVGTISRQEPVEYGYSEIRMIEVSVGSKKIYDGKGGFHYFPTIDKSKKNQSQLNEAFTKLLDVFNDCVYIVPSERDMLEVSFNSEKAKEEIKNLNSKSFKRFLYDLYLSPTRHHLFEAIDSTFSKEPFGFGKISFSEENEKLEVMINESGFRLPIKNLGSGVMQALFIITSITCSRSRIICIEELEQNLSPSMQIQMLRKIKQMMDGQAFDQLILSSHSSVYSKPALGIIYFLEKKDGVTSINKKEVKKLSEKLVKHLAETQFVFGDKELKEMQEFLKKEQDFK